ncbi:MAG TPA: 3'-5' exonuclease [Gemmatimonadaceae bacterium]|nr:3'-5' exonuclease [Gemmatimonadaceae bacterium]
MEGVHARPVPTLLTERALDFLAAGPAEAVPLIEHVCQLPGAPKVVAEQMALALFAERPEFIRDIAGRWCLAPTASAIPADVGRIGEPRGLGWLDRPRGEDLSTLTYAVVDVETTGTRAFYGDRVTEVAAVLVRNGVVAERYETLVNPERPIPRYITALTNISWDMVKDAPRFADICDDVVRMLDGRIFVAHNAEFDWRFLSLEVERATGRRLHGQRLCTVRLARKLLPQLRSRRLDSLAHFYGIDIVGRHRAGGDAFATAHILVRLLAAARDHECERWSDLERLLTTRRRRRRRNPAMPHSVGRDTTA